MGAKRQKLHRPRGSGRRSGVDETRHMPAHALYKKRQTLFGTDYLQLGKAEESRIFFELIITFIMP